MKINELQNSLMPGAQRKLSLKKDSTDVLGEMDLIVNPSDIKLVRDILSNKQDHHDVSMAKSDLIQCVQNGMKVLQLMRGMDDSDNVEAWVQEKIIKASDYLNTIREYLEGIAIQNKIQFSENDVDGKITKAPTAKERNAERIRQKRERQADSRKRSAEVFGTSPADKLSIRKSSGVTEGSNYSDSMTDAEWEREYQREKLEKELARKEIEKNHKSKFKTKEEAIQYANDKLKTFKDSKIGMSVYAMPDGGFDVASTARTAATEKLRKLISDAGGKHLGTLGPRYTKHKMKEQEMDNASNCDDSGMNEEHDPWKDKHFGPTTSIKKMFRVKTDNKSYKVKAETEQQARSIVEKHLPGTDIVSVEFLSNIMAETKSQHQSNVEEGKTGPGLWANIRAKRERIKAGSGEKMRKPGSEGAPTDSQIKSIRKSSESVNEEDLSEAEKDACYRKVKSRYKIWPSAYASGALVKCRKVGAKNWGNKSKK